MKIKLAPFFRDLKKILGIVDAVGDAVDTVDSAIASAKKPKKRIQTVGGRIAMIEESANNIRGQSDD